MNSPCSIARACHECGAMFRGNTRQIRCNGCRYDYDAKRLAATRAVRAAVQRGDLPSLKTGLVACVDCGARAEHYDHRDYNKPLLVEPVCRICNFQRGPAAPMRSAA